MLNNQLFSKDFEEYSEKSTTAPKPAIRNITTTDTAMLERLVERYPYNDLRRYRLVNREKQAAYLMQRLQQCMEGGLVLCVEKGGETVAAAGFRPLQWDSSIFGVEMGQIAAIIHDPARVSREDLEALIDNLTGECRSRGIKHLTTRIDADELSLAQSLESRGFYLVDAIVTYTFIPRRQELGHFKHLYQTRIYREEDREAVLHVANTAYQNYLGRYHADPHLPNEAANRLYQIWTEKFLQEGFAERIIVAERKGKVIGFLGYRMQHDILKATGVRAVGAGLGGCLPEGLGAYSALLETAMREGMHRYDMQDFETQLNNINIVRIYQKINFEFARAKYTFHAWLDS